MPYTDRFPPVAGFVSQAHLVFGSRVVQTAEGTGRQAEVSWNHQGAHCSTGGSTGQLGTRRRIQRVSLKSFTNNLSTEEIPLRHLRPQVRGLPAKTRIQPTTLKSVMYVWRHLWRSAINRSLALSTHVLGKLYPQVCPDRAVHVTDLSHRY